MNKTSSPALIIGVVGWLAFFWMLAGSALAQGTAPSYFVGCVTTTPYPLNPLFQTATAVVGVSATPSVTNTAIQNAPPNTPTIDSLTPLPSPTVIVGARYRVSSQTGVNVRAAPGTNQAIVSSLPFGAVVVVLEMRPDYVNGWIWGRINGGWVAVRSSGGVVNLVGLG